jgi:hypothetical protein
MQQKEGRKELVARYHYPQDVIGSARFIEILEIFPCTLCVNKIVLFQEK